MVANPVYIFKQAVSFGKGLSYSVGQHRIDPKIASLPYFQKLLKSGLVLATDGSKPAPAAPSAARNQVLANQQKAVASAKAQASAQLKPPAAEAPAPAKPVKGPVSVSKAKK